LLINESQEQYKFVNIQEKPVPSLLRGFSAPVKLNVNLSNEELLFLFANDPDEYNRWDAGYQFASRLILNNAGLKSDGNILSLKDQYINVLSEMLVDSHLKPIFITELISLPNEEYLGELVDVIDVDAIHISIKSLKKDIAFALREKLLSVYDSLSVKETYSFDIDAVGRRCLKNTCLGYLVLTEDSMVKLCMSQFEQADNMTDQFASLAVLSNVDVPERKQAFNRFYDQWQSEPLVIDKWFSLQARSELSTTLSTVKALLGHEAFDINNPNRIYSLVRGFSQNRLIFHDVTGEGYELLTDQIIKIDEKNPQVAARLVKALCNWRRYDKKRQELILAQLERIKAIEGTSKDVYELVEKSL